MSARDEPLHSHIQNHPSTPRRRDTLSTMPFPSDVALDRAIKVRVVDEHYFDADDPRLPGLRWSARADIDGDYSRVGLLSAQALNGQNDHPLPAGDVCAATAPRSTHLRLIGLLDRTELLPALRHARFAGVCDGAGLVFAENDDDAGALPRRWIVFPMEASGQVVA